MQTRNLSSCFLNHTRVTSNMGSFRTNPPVLCYWRPHLGLIRDCNHHIAQPWRSLALVIQPQLLLTRIRSANYVYGLDWMSVMLRDKICPKGLTSYYELFKGATPLQSQIRDRYRILRYLRCRDGVLDILLPSAPFLVLYVWQMWVSVECRWV